MKLIFIFFLCLASSRSEAFNLTGSELAYWKKLLHYRQGLDGVWKSEIVSDSFFLSPEGRINPNKELESFISEVSSNRGEEIACRFPLRYRWVKTTLKLNWSYDLDQCRDYLSYISKMDARNISLVFTSFYINNPGSTFGHTFLRVSRYKDFQSNELLDYAINFSAIESRDVMPLYILKGLTGYYPGRFGLIPYYYKIREYNDHEFRDIWDYDLGFSEEQIRAVLDHTWELAQIDFAYYYLTQNCSYQVMALLNVAFEKEDLLSHLNSFYVLPLDTVKVMSELNQVKASRLRPSSYQKLVEATLDFDKTDLDKMKKISRDGLSIHDEIIKDQSSHAAKILENSILALDYFEAEKVLVNDKKTMEKRHKILLARANNPTVDENFNLKKLTQKNPIESHHSSRLGLNWGDRSHHGQFQGLDWRSASHDLLDPPDGHPAYTEVVLLDLRARRQSAYFKSQQLVLERGILLSLKNYRPSSFWNNSISYDFSAGFEKRQECQSQDCLHPVTSFGLGSSVEPWTDHVASFLMGGNYALDPVYKNQSLFSFGPKMNWVSRFKSSTLGVFGAYYFPYELGGDWREGSLLINIDWRYYLSNQVNFFIKASSLDMESRPVQESQLGIYLFY
jgi:hypothetical protein